MGANGEPPLARWITRGSMGASGEPLKRGWWITLTLYVFPSEPPLRLIDTWVQGWGMFGYMMNTDSLMDLCDQPSLSSLTY